MKINSINNYQGNQTFKGYENLKLLNGRLVRAKEGAENSFKLFIAGGEAVDKKVAEANERITENLRATSSTNKNEPNSFTSFLRKLISPLIYRS